MQPRTLLVSILSAMLLGGVAPGQEATPLPVRDAIDRAGPNGPEIERAWRETSPSQRPGMAFLLEHMPLRDLTSLPAALLIENVALSYEAYERAPWRNTIPEPIFLNEILPYCFVTEDRAPWRAELAKQCRALVAGATSPSEAAARLNREIFPAFGVTFSQERSRTDQNVRQVLDEGVATCTGLSVLLASACRSVGVPARLAGTPMWPDSSGNHTWVEIWDGEWRFTGAAEPTGAVLDSAWFVERARTCPVDVPGHAIYATSYARTETPFPIAWNDSVDYVWGVNVTRRYTAERRRGAQHRARLQSRGSRRKRFAVSV